MINPAEVTREQFESAFNRWSKDMGDVEMEIEYAWKQFTNKYESFWWLTPYLMDELYRALLLHPEEVHYAMAA